MAETIVDQLAVVALGGNLPGPFGDTGATLKAALQHMTAAGIEPVRVSRWWRSAAWPDPADPPFLNGVALVRTDLSAEATLGVLHAIEADLGRARTRINAPRPLDLDLIAFGQAVIERADLVLPHPRAADRYFVMGPLAEIAPDWRHPTRGLSALALAQIASLGRDAAPISP